jgi:hypothetical protein
MNLKQLYYFKRLSETEHYTEAASSLCITQPSLSHAISELEKELGVALFARQGRNVKITQNGKRFLPYVEDALASLENGRMILQKNGAENKENIRIAFIYTMGEYVVPQLINKYSLSPECHNVTFSFTQGTSLTLLQELKAGKVDLAICSYIADEPISILFRLFSRSWWWSRQRIIRWPGCMNMKSIWWRRFIIPISIFQKIAAYVRLSIMYLCSKSWCRRSPATWMRIPRWPGWSVLTTGSRLCRGSPRSPITTSIS